MSFPPSLLATAEPESKEKIKALQSELTEGGVFCANDPCENPATHVVLPSATPLCYCCKTAYSWGQANPAGQFTDIETVEAFTEDL